MDSMTTTTSTTALIINPNPTNIDSWFSVCDKVNGGKGRRAVALVGCDKNKRMTKATVLSNKYNMILAKC